MPANKLPMNQDSLAQQPRTCRILSLDGGGAKGFYTLGVLKQLEALLGGGPLSDQFDLIFGTSTGGIIAALLALGRPVEDIRALYERHVPGLMAKSGCLSVKSFRWPAIVRDRWRENSFA